MPNDRPSATDAQIKKGVLEMCVLFLIKDEPAYGYDVMKTVRRCLPEVNESTVYAILRRLHGEGSAEVSLGSQSGGPTRKYYAITAKGAELLENDIASWRRVCGALALIGIS